MLNLTNNLRKLTIKSVLKYSFSNNNNGQRTQKIFMDEQSIKKKMKELKERSETLSQDQIKKNKTKQFMPTFTLPEVNKKVNQFRRETNTEDLFAFSDITLEEKPTVMQITAYDPQFFQVDNFQYPPAIILTPYQVFNWQVESAQLLSIDNFAILKCIQPPPDYVIVGVPDSTLIKNDLRQKVKKIHSHVDFLDIFQAISQYNTVTSDDKNCMAFMMSF